MAFWCVFTQQLLLRMLPRRCIVVADKPFGLTFSYVSGAPEAPASYFKLFGEQPDGKILSTVVVQLEDRPLVDPL